MKKKLIFAVIALFLIALGVLLKQNKQAGQGVHLHAGFQVYVNNELQDFSDFKYMNFKSCGEHDEQSLTAKEEQLEKAHLHDFIDDVVHVHREGARWEDLFKNIAFPILPSEVYVNGKKFEEDFLNYEIKHYDSVVIFQGENTDIEQKLNEQVTKDHILEVEKKSEYCTS